MTKDEENQLTMIESTSRLLDKNVEKLTIPALKNAVTELHVVNLKMKEKVQETMTATAGKARTKARAEDAVLRELMVISKELLAYGHKLEDQGIIEKAKVTEAQLRRMRDTEFVAKARTVHGLGDENLPAVEDYGVTNEKLDSLEARIDNFEEALGERETSVARRKGARAGFYDYLDQSKKLLENIVDNLMETYKETDPEFYNVYMETRVVKDVGLRHLTDAGTEQAQPAETK